MRIEDDRDINIGGKRGENNIGDVGGEEKDKSADINEEIIKDSKTTVGDVIAKSTGIVSKKKARDLEDAVISPMVMIYKSNRTLKLLSVMSLICLCIVSIALVLVLYYKEDKIVLLDSMGRPYLSQTTIKDDDVYQAELQHYIATVVPKILSVSYTTFMDEKYQNEYFQSISPFFDNAYKRQFKEAFLNSKYIQSVRNNKQIIKVWVDSIWDWENHPTKEGMKRAIGHAKIYILQNEGPPINLTKMYEIVVVKKERTIYNQYGLYIVLFTEK